MKWSTQAIAHQPVYQCLTGPCDHVKREKETENQRTSLPPQISEHPSNKGVFTFVCEFVSFSDLKQVSSQILKTNRCSPVLSLFVLLLLPKMPRQTTKKFLRKVHDFFGKEIPPFLTVRGRRRRSQIGFSQQWGTATQILHHGKVVRNHLLPDGRRNPELGKWYLTSESMTAITWFFTNYPC